MRSDTAFKPNTHGLLAHAQRKKQEAQQRVHQAMDRLLREQQTVNFNTVAKAAQVTKSYLYAHPEVRDRVEALRAQQDQERLQKRRAKSQLQQSQLQQGRTDKTKDVLLAAKDRRIKELEEENRKLKLQLKVALGKAYDRL